MNTSYGSKRYLAAGAVAMALATLAIACGGDDTVNPPPSTPTLTSVSVTPTTVAGGGTVQGTVTLSSAPSSAASVTLSSNNAAATVSGTVTVAAGATSANFTVNTTAVGAATAVSITATFSGTSMSTTLTVTAPVLAANFTVKASSAVQRKLSSNPAPVTIFPAGTEDACPLVNANFDCVFDGTTSTTPSGPIQSYIWTYFVGTRTRTEPSTSPVYKPSESSCNFFGGSADDEFGQRAIHQHAGGPAGSGCGGKPERGEIDSERPHLPGWSVRLRVLTPSYVVSAFRRTVSGPAKAGPHVRRSG